MAKTTTGGSRKVALNLASLGDLSAGQSRAVIDAAIRAAVRDTEDRGSDKKKRKVTIELELGKVGESVTATVRAKTTLPPYQTEPTVGALTPDGKGGFGVEFNPNAPGNPDQKSFDEDDDSGDGDER